MHHLASHQGVQSLFGEGGSQCEATEKEEEDRVGEVGERLAHVKDPEHSREQGHQQCGDGDMESFSQPEDGDEDQNAQPLVDHGVKR